MEKKNLLILGVIIALSAIMVVSASVIYSFTFNMTANVAETGSVTINYGGQDYTNGQSLPIDWSTVSPGQQYTQSITITNNVNTAVTPVISNTNLPNGWSLTLSDTSAIPAFGTVTRSLMLSVPSNAIAGASSWTTTLTVS